jgi:hypothetical protein
MLLLDIYALSYDILVTRALFRTYIQGKIMIIRTLKRIINRTDKHKKIVKVPARTKRKKNESVRCIWDLDQEG